MHNRKEVFCLISAHSHLGRHFTSVASHSICCSTVFSLNSGLPYLTSHWRFHRPTGCVLHSCFITSHSMWAAWQGWEVNSKTPIFPDHKFFSSTFLFLSLVTCKVLSYELCRSPHCYAKADVLINHNFLIYSCRVTVVLLSISCGFTHSHTAAGRAFALSMRRNNNVASIHKTLSLSLYLFACTFVIYVRKILRWKKQNKTEKTQASCSMLWQL